LAERGLGLPPKEKAEKAVSSGYGSVPWLYRKHALTMLPSVASLNTNGY